MTPLSHWRPSSTLNNRGLQVHKQPDTPSHKHRQHKVADEHLPEHCLARPVLHVLCMHCSAKRSIFCFIGAHRTPPTGLLHDMLAASACPYASLALPAAAASVAPADNHLLLAQPMTTPRSVHPSQCRGLYCDHMVLGMLVALSANHGRSADAHASAMYSSCGCC